jgi:hypothetical protein
MLGVNDHNTRECGPGQISRYLFTIAMKTIRVGCIQEAEVVIQKDHLELTRGQNA